MELQPSKYLPSYMPEKQTRRGETCMRSHRAAGRGEARRGEHAGAQPLGTPRAGPCARADNAVGDAVGWRCRATPWVTPWTTPWVCRGGLYADASQCRGRGESGREGYGRGGGAQAREVMLDVAGAHRTIGPCQAREVAAGGVTPCARPVLVQRQLRTGLAAQRSVVHEAKEAGEAAAARGLTRGEVGAISFGVACENTCTVLGDLFKPSPPALELARRQLSTTLASAMARGTTMNPRR